MSFISISNFSIVEVIDGDVFEGDFALNRELPTPSRLLSVAVYETCSYICINGKRRVSSNVTDVEIIFETCFITLAEWKMSEPYQLAAHVMFDL